MNKDIIRAIAAELKIEISQVNNTLSLLEDGNTVPFIARYRKEATHGLDEEQILYIQKQYDYQLKLAERKENVLKLISEQGKLTDEIKIAVNGCDKLSQVEDLYRPYAQKKKTRAAVAIKAGLQPFADWILTFPARGDLKAEAGKYINEEIKTVDDAIQGAKDIIAEAVSDNASLRWAFKENILKSGSIVTKIKKGAVDERKVYEMYYDHTERISSMADHRIMAIDRAEKEKVVTVSLLYDKDRCKEKAYVTISSIRPAGKAGNVYCSNQTNSANNTTATNSPRANRVHDFSSLSKLSGLSVGADHPSKSDVDRTRSSAGGRYNAPAAPAYPKAAPEIEAAIRDAVSDGCDRLLLPGVEREIRSDLSTRAQNKSIEIFSMNLEKLLLQPPLKGRVVMGFDPAFRTGCKLAVLDATGKVLHIDKIFPTKPNIDLAGSKSTMLKLIKEFKVAIIAIGNGTASRESEQFVSDLIRDNHLDVSYAIVSEAGASVYSASEIARTEFPDLHVEERSAVSIGRRLLDPLAELIKIDPQSIGVGQYQHDLPEKDLSARLDEVVMKAVNRTGADLNTASPELLTHISGLNKAVAKEIVNFRNTNGRFTNRRQLLKVSKLGPKAYTQCAGFLRIVGGDNPLDETSIHPESYDAASKLMKACGVTELGAADIEFPVAKTSSLDIDSYTLKDIEDAIKQPLRDYRDQFQGVLLKSDILDIKDLHVGEELMGTVRNVVDFGAFVDIGLHEDGLVHISHMSRKRIAHPSDLVAVGDIVKVWVYGIDENKGRVQLSLVEP